MSTYFIPFQHTGVIGLISAILGGLYTYGISLLFNFAIQHSKQCDLRLRIATTYGIFGLVKEITNSGKGPLPYKTAFLCTILLLTLAGKSLSFIITTGIKASTGIQMKALETVETRLGTATLEILERGDSRSILQEIYDAGDDVNFKVLANSTPIRVAEVQLSNTGKREDDFGPGTPGTFSFVRQIFQLRVPKTIKQFVNVAQDLIGSGNPHYPAIFTALNASIPKAKGATPSTEAILVFNNPTAASNNLTHVLCIGHQGAYFGTNHNPEYPEAMISCRETRVTVMANKAFKARVKPENPPPVETNSAQTVEEKQEPDDPRIEYQEKLSSPYGDARVLLTLYNVEAPTLMTLKDIIIGKLAIDSLDKIDQRMPALLKDIADRVAPLNAEFVAKVVPYITVPGIEVEPWAIIFLVIEVLIVTVLFVLDQFKNDAISRASVTTLIERSTAQ
ncbi:hypothetical protein BGZ68_008798 [Mortierella alpina]|nr:hypothetical protein BGZ68_008798 [Mortierella alpina]